MAQKGRLLLLKVGDGADPEVFSNACGFKARSFTINNNIVDTTVPDCDSPGNLVANSGEYGIQTVNFSGSGESKDGTTNAALRDAARAQTALNAQVVVPGDGTFEGAVLIGSFEYCGDMEGNMEFSCDITFSGTVSYTAEA